MKNLIIVALIVSVMLVFAVGTASADFVGGEGDTRADRTAEASGSVSEDSGSEEGGGSGGSGGLLEIIQQTKNRPYNQPDESLRFRFD